MEQKGSCQVLAKVLFVSPILQKYNSPCLQVTVTGNTMDPNKSGSRFSTFHVICICIYTEQKIWQHVEYCPHACYNYHRVPTIRENQGEFYFSGKSGKVREFNLFFKILQTASFGYKQLCGGQGKSGKIRLKKSGKVREFCRDM